MDSDSSAGLGLLLAALAFFAVVVAAEAGVVAGLQAQMQAASGRQVSRLEVLRRYSQEQHLARSSLALARTLTLIAITAIVVFLVIEALGRSWAWVTLAAFITLVGLMLFQALPRLLVSHNPDRWSNALRPFVRLTVSVLGLPALLLDLPVTVVLRWWRTRYPEAAGEAAEMIRLAEIEATPGAIDETEREMIRGVMELEQTLVREVMVPRIDIVAVEAGLPFEEVAKLIIDKGHSRLPIYEEQIDNIVGVVFAREVLRYLAEEIPLANIREIALSPYFVPESKKVDDLLAEMRRNKMSIAIVVDEYGGTAGLVTVEDVMEEIVGEIADEFDDEEEEVQRLTDGEVIVDAKVSMDALNELFGLDLAKDDFDTLGGFIYDRLGKMPSVGDEVDAGGALNLRVLSMMGRRIKKVRATMVESDLPKTQANGQQTTD